jgi:hypothetical protein
MNKKKSAKRSKVRIYVKSGKLEGYSINDSMKKRRSILKKLSKKSPYATIIKRLNVLAIYNKNRYPETTKKIQSDMSYLRKNNSMKKRSMKKRSMKKRSMKKRSMKKPSMKKPSMKKPSMKKPSMKKSSMKKSSMKKRSMKKGSMKKGGVVCPCPRINRCMRNRYRGPGSMW